MYLIIDMCNNKTSPKYMSVLFPYIFVELWSNFLVSTTSEFICAFLIVCDVGNRHCQYFPLYIQ